MSIFADCYPRPLIATLEMTELRGECSGCGHISAWHSRARGCAACEHLQLIASSFGPMLERVERLEASGRVDESSTERCAAVCRVDNRQVVCEFRNWHKSDHRVLVEGCLFNWPRASW